MSKLNYNAVTIKVEGTDYEFHTLNDWSAYVQNSDCIGDPVQYTRYIEIPGRNGLLDVSEVISGRQIYTSRPLKIVLAGIREKADWDSVISDFRNKINGRICQFIFDNDPGYFWRGRVAIKNFSSVLSRGSFEIDIPTADPYKYAINSSTDPWLWDPFNFETGVITYIGAITIVGSGSITLPHGYMATSPDIIVSNKTSGTFTVTYDGDTYELNVGKNRIPSIIVGGDEDVTLTFTGNARVEIVYRSGSL
ncbi:MAG: phage tail family protein [Lachnospiraceae bacterium]|nr:phage tail family protein [Lachnospiraceae bacterium]